MLVCCCTEHSEQAHAQKEDSFHKISFTIMVTKLKVSKIAVNSKSSCEVERGAQLKSGLLE